MKIFTDLHHEDLYYSLHLLFVERLGYELYRPIGYEWYHKGYWKIGDPYPNPLNTAAQYLDLKKGAYHPYTCLNGEHFVKDNVYHIFTPPHNYYQKAITFEHFQNMKFDIIMPTFPGHDKPFENLRNKFQPQAKMIMQMGNINQRTHLPNVLHSCAYNSKPNQHCLRYHQEIDPKFYYYSSPSSETKNIYSIINCAPYLNIYNQYKNIIADAIWKYYGAQSPNGALFGSQGVSEKMREANIAWHLKPHGGVGHSTKGWFAIGRPLITNMSQHKKAGGDALKLFVPDVTCIDLDTNSTHINEKKIRALLDPDINKKWSERVHKRFKEVIDYDGDEQRVKKFLENLR